MRNLGRRVEILEKKHIPTPVFIVHLKSGQKTEVKPADAVKYLQYPLFETVTHFSAEGDLSGYGEFLGLFNALLDVEE